MRPTRLDLFLTEACNLRCPYCFAAGGRRNDPSLEACLDAVDWLLEGKPAKAHITFWGGEPLLRRDRLVEVAGHARQRAAAAGTRLTLSMPTNATLLDEEALEWIDASRVQIFLSMDGAEETQAGRPLASGGSSFELASRGLELALGSAISRPPAIRMTVTPDSAKRLGRDVAYFLSQGVREVLAYPAMDCPWPESALESYRQGQHEVAALLVRELERCQSPDAVPLLKAYRPILGRLLRGVPRRPRSGPVRGCGAGTDLVAFAADGAFYPCHRFVYYARRRPDALRMGDLESGLDHTVAEPIASVAVEDLTGQTGRCVDCDIYDLCTLGCVAINYAATGAYHRVPAAACELMRAQVDGCRDVHHAMAGNPRYAVYAGQDLEQAVREAATELGSRAYELYHGSVEPEEGSMPKVTATEEELRELMKEVLSRLARDRGATHLWHWRERPGCEDEPPGRARRSHLATLLGLMGAATLPGALTVCSRACGDDPCGGGDGGPDGSSDSGGDGGDGGDGGPDGCGDDPCGCGDDPCSCADDPCAADGGPDGSPDSDPDAEDCADDPCGCGDDPCGCGDDPCSCADDPCAADGGPDGSPDADSGGCADDPCMCGDDPCAS